MKRASSWTWAGALLFFFALFATPLHLALEAHEWVHEQSAGDHRHDDDGESHPAADHELTALSRPIKILPATVECLTLDVRLPEPEVRFWVPRVDLESNGPPDRLPTPPRSPRAPPL